MLNFQIDTDFLNHQHPPMNLPNTIVAARDLSSEEKGVIRALLYFGVFRYPLRQEEIWETMPKKVGSAACLEPVLARLLADGMVKTQDGFYWVNGDGAVERRLKGNSLAAQTMPNAYRWSRFIAKFPYVRGVMLSGSLSKGYMEEGSDIDYFIITQSGRLWVARTLLVMYKKIFLLNSHKEFCVNYFVDEEHLAIEDRNVFTATETEFLFPTINPTIYHQFREQNGWAKQFFPQSKNRLEEQCGEYSGSRIGRMVEKVLNGRLGERFDRWCMKQTLRRWQKKFGHFDKEQFELALRTRTYVSKHHPSDFQSRVLNRLQETQAEFESRFGVKLS